MSRYFPGPTYHKSIEGGVICVVDESRGMSVTNGAECMIDDLLKEGLDLKAMPLIYRDSEGNWDMIEVYPDGKRFASFRFLNADRNKELAKKNALEIFVRQ